MSKILSLTFAILTILIFIGVGISLSYRELWIALILTVAAILTAGLGFIIKAKLRR